MSADALKNHNGVVGVQGPVKVPCTDPRPYSIQWSLDPSSDVGRALLAASGRLRETGNDTAQLDSAVLMAHVLGVSKTWLYAHPTRQLHEAEITAFEDLVRRRMCQEPVAYLVGYKAFYGLDISVDRRVLIPRPETEMLVERAINHLKRLSENSGPTNAADVGTGSGAIAVSLAVNVPDLTVFATDISDDALAVAGQNLWRYGVGDRVQLLPGHLLEPVSAPLDLVVANLPYIATPDLATLAPQIRDYEPYLALDGGPDGLDVFRALFAFLGSDEGRKRLKPRAGVFLEIGSTQGDAVRSLAASALPGAEVEMLVDYAGLPRLVVAVMGS